VPAVFAVEETFLGVRRLFEILAADRLLVVVLDDLHWVEPTLLELIAEVVERVRRPCLVVVTARPEYVDREDAIAEGPARTRLVLERLPAVAALTFPRAAVSELVADEDRPCVPERLSAVERRRFIHAHSAVMGDPNSYQFEHILVRDAVYRRLLKRTRAQMHERFVAWADG